MRPAAPQTVADRDEQLEARELVQRLEGVVLSADVAAYEALLSPSADPTRASAFTSDELKPGASHVVIQERERLRVTRAGVDGLFFRMIVDVFAEYGSKARVATWQLETERASNGRWRITNQERLSSVENLYRLALNRIQAVRRAQVHVKAEDLDLTLVEGTVFTVDTDAGTTGLVLMGHGEMRFRPTPETEQGQVRIFSGDSAIEGRFDVAYLRMGAVEPHATLSQLVERPVDARDLRRAEQIFREESSKSFVSIWVTCPAMPGRCCPRVAISSPKCAPGASTPSPTPARSRSPKTFPSSIGGGSATSASTRRPRSCCRAAASTTRTRSRPTTSCTMTSTWR